MSTIGGQNCPMCGDRVEGSMQVHYLKCKGGETATSPGSPTSEQGPSPHKVNVQFTWQPYGSLTYAKVTLLSAFQNVEMAHSTSGTHYSSEYVSVPVGEYDGQIVLGSSYSYMYAVKKFMVEKNNDVIVLEIDPTKLETEDDSRSSSSDYTYDRSGGGREGDAPITVTFNPAYKTQYGGTGKYSSGYDDDRLEEGTTVLYVRAISPSTSPAYSSHSYNTGYQKHSALPPPPPLDDHTSSDDEPQSHDDFSQQLSAEGFAPAPVKSKMAQRRPPKPSHTSTSNSSSTRPRPPPPPTSTVGKTAVSGTVSTVSAGSTQSKGFSVSQVKSQGSSDQSYEELQAELTELKREKDQLVSNYKRLSAQWERRVKRLEDTLKADGKELPVRSGNDAESQDHIATLEQELEELKRDRDAKEEELMNSNRELSEVKDRLMAVESQLTEYAGTIQDQSKLIRTYSQSRHGSTSQLEEQITYVTQYNKKQQLEYQQSISALTEKLAAHRADLEKTMISQKEQIQMLELTKRLSQEIEQYRSKVRQLLAEGEEKNIEIVQLRDQLEHMELRGGNSRGDDLELATMKEKYQAYREETERLVMEVEDLKGRLQVSQAEKDAMAARQQELLLQQQAHLVQSSEVKEKELSSKKQSELSQLQERFGELQQVRMKMEKELATLRSERAEILQQNAMLMEASNIDKYTKLKKEHGQLSAQRKQLQALLEEEKEKAQLLHDKNLQLQQQLEEATNPEKLAAIQQKMGRYKQERDQARDKAQSLQAELGQGSRQELERALQDVAALQNKVAQLTAKKNRYREERNQIVETAKTLEIKLAEKDALLESYQLQLSLDGAAVEEEEVEEERGSEEYDDLERETTDNVSPSSPSLSSASLPKLTTQAKSSTLPRSMPVKSSLATTSTGSLTSSAASAQQPLQSVEVETTEGARTLHIQQLPRPKATTESDIEVVVKRKDGTYAKGRLKYVGTPTGMKETMAGIALDLPRKDSDNDGQFKDGKRFFKCAKGHGLYTTLANVYAVVYK